MKKGRGRKRLKKDNNIEIVANPTRERGSRICRYCGGPSKAAYCCELHREYNNTYLVYENKKIIKKWRAI